MSEGRAWEQRVKERVENEVWKELWIRSKSWHGNGVSWILTERNGMMMNGMRGAHWVEQMWNWKIWKEGIVCLVAFFWGQHGPNFTLFCLPFSSPKQTPVPLFEQNLLHYHVNVYIYSFHISFFHHILITSFN